MSTEKIQSLTKYVEDMKQRLVSPTVPERRKNQEVEYRKWVATEIKKTSKKIEDLLLAGPGKGK